ILTFQNHTDCPLTDFGGKTSIFSHPVYLFLRKFSLQDSRGGSNLLSSTRLTTLVKDSVNQKSKICLPFPQANCQGLWNL
ncbi:hypothetical protein U9408_26570, partial [Escherichia coli]